MTATDLRAQVLVTAEQLALEMGLVVGDRTVAKAPLVLDVRWTLPPAGQVYDGLAAYQTGHLPRAVFVDLDTELAEPPTPTAGRHPLPKRIRLQTASRLWGQRKNVPVVAYDDWSGLAAARAWWLLRDVGVKDVRILDGGLAAWRRAGLPISTEDFAPLPGDNTLFKPGQMPQVDADGVAALAVDPDVLLLDARAGERYRGEVEPIDPRAGHIPGAISAPTSDNLNADGTFRSAAELIERFVALGVRVPAESVILRDESVILREVAGSPDTGVSQQVAVYCGSGVTAAHQIAALASIGVEAALYPGSWSQWANDETRPIATGPNPMGE